MDVANLVSVSVGVAGLVVALWQGRALWRRKQHDYRRYWDMAKLAHILMARLEAIKANAEKDGAPLSVSAAVAYGETHGHAVDIMRLALQNVFLQDIAVDERQVAYMKEKGLLAGALLQAFDQMRLTPPKLYEPPVLEAKSPTGV